MSHAHFNWIFYITSFCSTQVNVLPAASHVILLAEGKAVLQGSFSHCAADPRFSAMLQESSTASAETSQLPSADSAHGSTPPSSDNTHSVNGAVDVSPVDEGAAAAGFAAVVAAAAVATVAAAVDGHVGGSEKESPVASGGNLLQCFSISSSKVSKGESRICSCPRCFREIPTSARTRGSRGPGEGAAGRERWVRFPHLFAPIR